MRGALVLALVLATGSAQAQDDRGRAEALRGARAVDEGRDREGARALEAARRAGFRPVRVLYPLLVVAYARLGDVERARDVARAWGRAAPPVVARLRPPRLAVRGELGAGWDGNVRLDAAQGATGVSAPFAAARLELAVRPFQGADESVAVSLDQRVHLAERDRTALYDLALLTLATGGERLLPDGSVLVGVDLFGQLVEGEAWKRHVALAGGASLRAGLHPIGRNTIGLQGAFVARDLDGEALGDPSLDGQDGIAPSLGLFGRFGLPRLGGRLALDIAYEELAARADEWDERGLGAGALLDLRLGRVTARASARWHFGRYRQDDRSEHRLAGLVEAAWDAGWIAPFVRVVADAAFTTAPHRYSRLVGLGGVSIAWRSH